MHNPRSTPPEPSPEDRDRPVPLEGGIVPDDADDGSLGPICLPAMTARRHRPWLLVEADGSASGHGALVWALREAARREATVLAVAVLDGERTSGLGTAQPPPAREQADALHRLEAQVLRAMAETGVHGRARTAVLERPVFEALSDAACGADLVIVGTAGKTVLRPALPRPRFRRLPRGA